MTKEAEAQLDNDAEKPEEIDTEQTDILKFIDSVTHDFALLQLPANLPLEGCYQQTPKFENTDINLKTNDLLSALLNNKFDSTGCYLEREFSTILDKNIIKDKKDAGLVIGKLCKLRNGKIKMKIGENLFDINEGVQENFYKEIMAINSHDHEALSLMKLQNKLIVKPDISDILNSK